MSPPAGPGQRLGGGPGGWGMAPGSSEDTSFYSTKNGPKIDAFLPGYYIRPGGEAPEALKILHFTVPKMGLKLMHFCRGL